MSGLMGFFGEQNQMFFDALGEAHNIDGRAVVVVVDTAALKRREDKSGIHLGELMYFAQPRDFARSPRVGEAQQFDGRWMTIEEVSDETSLLRVVLSQNRG